MVQVVVTQGIEGGVARCHDAFQVGVLFCWCCCVGAAGLRHCHGWCSCVLVWAALLILSRSMLCLLLVFSLWLFSCAVFALGSWCGCVACVVHWGRGLCCYGCWCSCCCYCRCCLMCSCCFSGCFCQCVVVLVAADGFCRFVWCSCFVVVGGCWVVVVS